MAYLIDSNIFLRLVPADDPDRLSVLRALARLRADNEDLFYTSQVLPEFWTVCTRPASARGGYGALIGKDRTQSSFDRAVLSFGAGQLSHPRRVAPASHDSLRNGR